MAKARAHKAAPGPIRIDLACGNSKQQGFFGVDIAQLPGVDLVWDLDRVPWPFADDSVEEVFCSHYVEHTTDLILFMNELHRILKTAGRATIVCPYYSSMRCWQDPTHKRAISESSFLYYNRQWREQNHLEHYPIKADFDFSYAYLVSPEWASRSEESRSFAIRHYWNVVNDIQINLVKRSKT